MPASPLSATPERRLFRELLSPELLTSLQVASPNTVYTPYIVVWLLIYQRLHANAPLADAVAEFLTQFPKQAVAKAQHGLGSEVSANTGAYSHARTRLEPALARTVADHATNTLLDATAPVWNNRRVFLLDGTTLQLTHTRELCKAFPPASNQHGQSHWPILHVLVAHELDTALALRPEFGPMYGPQAVSELTLTLRMLPRLPANSVVLADRNFGVFAVAHAAQSSGRDVVVRLTQARFNAIVKSAKLEEPGRWSVTWQPTRSDRKSCPELPADAQVVGWLHEVVIRKDLTLLLFTTCAESGRELSELYGRRLEVETDIRDVKQTLALDRVTGKAEGMVEKELVLGVLAYNLVNQIRRLAARQAEVPPRRLSFAGVWSFVRLMLSTPGEDWSEEEWERQFDRVLRWAGQRKLPQRTTRRSFSRTIIPRRTRFPKQKPTTKNK